MIDEIVGGAVQRIYTYGLQRISQSQFISGAWTPSFYGYDGGGTVRQLTNSAGTVTDTYEYDAFGNMVAKTGPAPSTYTPNNYLYRGEQWDPDLGLYSLRARYYNPVAGRFLSRDPQPGRIVIPRTLHKYLYASGDPVDRIDPSGQADLVEDEEADSVQSAESKKGLQNIAKRVRCILETATGAVNAVDALLQGDFVGALGGTISIDWAECTAEGEPGEPEPGKGNCCFAAGTPVHTGRGDVPVEKIEVGDEVVSRNRATGKLEPEPVTALTPLHKDWLLEMHIEGQRTPLRPSIDHPFWVKRGDAPDGVWLEADQVKVGDLVQSMQGAWRRVVSITPLPGQETVYNFTVDKNHDYFVGETGFLVHNARCECSVGPFNGRSGPPGRLNPLNPGLAAAAEATVGAIGTFYPGVAHPIGACAEFDAANQAMNAGGDLPTGPDFGPATRGGEPVAPCLICQRMFGLVP